MNKEEIAKIKELKSKDGVHRFNDKDGTNVGILILNRGEQMFYQENDKGFICEISARNSILFPKTIKKWDNGEKISEDEKNKIIERISLYYKEAYQDELSISNN